MSLGYDYYQEDNQNRDDDQGAAVLGEKWWNAK
jgi:hypothetical protein